MTNKEKYANIFCETLEIEADKLQGLQYQGTELWDSVGHMTLVANLEEAFDIMLDTDDIIDLSSFEKGMEILSKNYNIEF
ncbi:MAG: acyl carrier protein [Bacteroidales bacterium]|nr:acyl carrier protein [Bacteroidales bacterium]MBD5235060.1 acyl carrier protein [Barnesiella sp.]MBD5247877.1 acyl carrier protein [Barnesiella sp.]MBD5257529.1 acyl carrier protein [Barnesiella sp.]